MHEKPLMVPVTSAISLEARYAAGIRPRAALLCHPHPLYGGDMDNTVVMALQGVFQALGWGTLRFNFRGVGNSTGEYGDGTGEREDLLAVAQALRDMQKELSLVCLAGYSYGAWVALGAVGQGLPANATVLVSPPLDFLNFDGLTPPSVPCLITLGDRDDFCAVDSLRGWLHGLHYQPGSVQVEVVAGADHFYCGQEILLQSKVRDFLRKHAP
jgi:alpha/beta superfamily hydrolase